MFSSPKAAQEDPAITAQRKAEKDRAEADKIRSIQRQLQLQTQERNQGSGAGSLWGSLFGGRRGLTSLLGSG